jgi:hexosaminidase
MTGQRPFPAKARVRRILGALAAWLLGLASPASEILPPIPAPRSFPASAAAVPVKGDIRILASGALRGPARLLAEDLRTGQPGRRIVLGPASSKARPGTFEIRLETAPVAEAEGYELEVGPGRATLRAAGPAGAFLGTRTLLQLLLAGDALPAGILRDAPTYPTRGLLLDVGRKFFPYEDLLDVVRVMGHFKLNTLHLHLNDNTFGAYALGGFRVESRRFPGLASKDGFYTWAQLRALQDFARARGITVLPEFDTPGHSRALTALRPDLAHPRLGANYLDITNPESLAFVKAILDELVPLFDSKDIHIGTDEYRLRAIKDPAERERLGELFRRYINELNRHLRTRHHRTAWIWSGYELMPGATEPDRDIVIDMWETADAAAKSKAGYRFVNSSHHFTYIVPGAPYYGVDDKAVYEAWTPLRFSDEPGGRLEPGAPGLLGGKLHIWNDLGPGGFTPREILALALPSLQAFSEKLWGTKGSPDFAAFRARGEAHGKIPGVRLLQRPALGAAGVVFEHAGPTHLTPNTMIPIPAGRRAENLEHPWTATFELTRARDAEGDEVLLGSPLATFFLDFTREEKDPKTGAVTKRRGVACVRATHTPGPEPHLGELADAIVFDHAVPLGQRTTLTFVGERGRTSLYADGVLVGTKPVQMVLPLVRLGDPRSRGFQGVLHRVGLTGTAAPPSPAATTAVTPR